MVIIQHYLAFHFMFHNCQTPYNITFGKFHSVSVHSFASVTKHWVNEYKKGELYKMYEIWLLLFVVGLKSKVIENFE